MNKIYERWQQTGLKQSIETRRVILITGARQSGKTTLCRAVASSNATYRTLDNTASLQAAQADPKTFVQHDSQMLVIDEVQYAPGLLPEIKIVVDQNNRPGQYLLTGSSNIQALPAVKESLAGRIKTVRLRTLVQGEILGKEPNFLSSAFGEKLVVSDAPSQKDLLELALRGGFPEVVRLYKNAHKDWHTDYINALIERDLQDLAHIRHAYVMNDLVRVLATWSSKFMEISSIGSALAITRITLESYISALEMMYLVERVPAWAKTDYGRVGKQSKIFMTDSGLMSSVLGYSIDSVLSNQDSLGKVFETFVFNELATQIDVSRDSDYRLFHYRDREKREIDFLVERSDGALLGIEVKASATAQDNAFKHLRWFKDNIAHDRKFTGIVLYSGDAVIPFGPNMFAVPICSLWA